MKISDLKKDTKNANKGTARGRKMLASSLKNYGAGRSILIDRQGRIIAGNKTVEQAEAAGVADVIVVKSDGKKLVAVQRTDLDLNDKKARALAIADNRAGELDLAWDHEVLQELAAGGVDLSEFFESGELKVAEESDVILDQAVQLEPGREFVVVVCQDATEFEALRVKLKLRLVRRGGYKPGSPFDAHGIERVIPAARLLAEKASKGKRC